MTRPTAIDRATLATAALIVAGGAWMALAGPAGDLPYHFGPDGRADAWTTRLMIGVGLMLLGGLTLVLAGAMGLAAARARDEARARGLRAGQVVILLVFLGLALFAGATSAAGTASLGAGAPMAGLSLLFLAIGAFVGRVGPNPIVGVRTPWAYKSRLAWDRSNRLAGRLFCLIGLGGLLAAPFAPQPLGYQLLIAGVLAAAVWSAAESWRVWRADPDRQPF